MGKNKNNQAKEYFSYKNDDEDLVELGDFLRDVMPYKVVREWYVIFEKMTGKYLGFQKTFNGNLKYIPRNPDLILVDKKTNKIVLVIEIDGSIHEVHFAETEDRNKLYEDAGLPLLVVNTREIITTLDDIVYRKVNERLGL